MLEYQPVNHVAQLIVKKGAYLQPSIHTHISVMFLVITAPHDKHLNR